MTHQTDNRNLSQALLFKSADDWTRAINAEMKQMKAEDAHDAITTVPRE